MSQSTDPVLTTSPTLQNAPARTVSADYEQALMDLSVTLAHRIRSFVAGIEGYTDLLADSLGTAEQREMALRIFEGAARIERVLADLQVYGRPVEPMAVPLRAADLALEMSRFLDEAEAEQFSTEIDLPEDHAVLGDPGLLQQALLMLLRNAFEATKQRGPVLLRLLKREDGATRFEVWNEGVVAVEDAESRVFTPFFSTKAQNLGIGLPIARRIAEAHGGSLTLAASTPDEGTCFVLTLPGRDEPFASLLDF